MQYVPPKLTLFYVTQTVARPLTTSIFRTTVCLGLDPLEELVALPWGGAIGRVALLDVARAAARVVEDPFLAGLEGLLGQEEGGALTLAF